MNAAIIALEARLKQMEDAFNVNTKIFSDAIQMLEAQNAVLRTVLQDVHGSSTPLLVDDKGIINFGQYMSDFIAQMVLHEELTKSQKADASGSVLLASAESEEEVSVFGGSR